MLFMCLLSVIWHIISIIFNLGGRNSNDRPQICRNSICITGKYQYAPADAVEWRLPSHWQEHFVNPASSSQRRQQQQQQKPPTYDLFQSPTSSKMPPTTFGNVRMSSKLDYDEDQETVSSSKTAVDDEVDKTCNSDSDAASLPCRKVAAFLGIPYAEKPRRFEPSRLLEWPTHNSTFAEHGAACWQTKDLFVFGEFEGATMWNARAPLSEDCLNLNVYSPAYTIQQHNLKKKRRKKKRQTGSGRATTGSSFGGDNVDIVSAHVTRHKNGEFFADDGGFDDGESSLPAARVSAEIDEDDDGEDDEQILLPVLVWIYGGGFYYGSASLDLYDGEILALKANAVVVAMNYRNSAFGFLHMPSPQHPGVARGNMGLRDQTQALRWIKRNIHLFGGNPNQITIFGESSGAVSVGFHILYDDSREQLFHRALMQSGSPTSPWAFHSPKAAEEVSRLTAYRSCKATDIRPEITPSSTNAELLDCLLAMNSTHIERWHSEFWEWTDAEFNYVNTSVLWFPFSPTIDGEFVTEDPTLRLRSGRTINAVDLIIGSNLNEAAFFIIYQLLDPYIMAYNTTEKDYMHINLGNKFDYRVNLTLAQFYETREKTHMYWPQLNNTQRREYNRLYIEPFQARHPELVSGTAGTVNGEDVFQLMDTVVGDWGFICGVNEFAAHYYRSTRSLGSPITGKAPDIYMYYFKRRSDANVWPLFMGTLHADEIDFFFGRTYKQSTASQADRALSNAMIQAFGAFAANGDPSYAYPSWKPWRYYNYGYQILDIVNTSASHFDADVSAMQTTSSPAAAWRYAATPSSSRKNEANYRYSKSKRSIIKHHHQSHMMTTMPPAALHGNGFFVSQDYVSGTLPRQDTCPFWHSYPLPTT